MKAFQIFGMFSAILVKSVAISVITLSGQHVLHEASVEGSPVMRPLVYEFQHDEQVWEESFVFMLGRSLLIANVLEPGAASCHVYLPKGSSWIDWQTKKRYSGGRAVELPVNLASIPMFMRSGSVIPLAVDFTNIHQDRMEVLQLVIEPSENTSFSLYEDDGTTNEYKNGQYLTTTIGVQAGEQTKITFQYEGQYTCQVKQLVVDLLCPDIAPVHVYLQGTKLPMFLGLQEWEKVRQGWYYDIESCVAKLKYKPPHHD